MKDQFNCRIEAETKKAISERADIERLPLGEIVEKAVKLYLANPDPAPQVDAYAPMSVVERLQAQLQDLEHRLGESNEALLKFIGNDPKKTPA